MTCQKAGRLEIHIPLGLLNKNFENKNESLKVNSSNLLELQKLNLPKFATSFCIINLAWLSDDVVISD